MRRLHSSISFALALLLCGGVFGAVAQAPSGGAGQQPSVDGSVEKTPPVEERPDPLKRRLSDGAERQRRKALSHELSPEDKKWLDEDVRWIITDEETQAFKHLANEEEREQFI